MKVLKDQIKEFLDSHDSAPGAHVFVLSEIKEVSDAEISQIYEESEGVNDTARNQIIDNMSSLELMKLSAHILEIALEKLADLEASA
jgi:hypothetical protein